MRALVLALALLAAAPAAAEDLPADRLWVVDGDTLDITGPTRERIRLLAIDAPETWKPHCAAEKEAGARAKAAAIAMVRAGRTVTLTRNGHRDVYGRTLADVAIDGRDLGRSLLEAGLALPWHPGPADKAKRIAHWCGGQP